MKKTPNKPPVTGKRFDNLQPLTKQREVVACDMGLRFGFTANYRAQYFLRDTIIVLWLRSIMVSETPGKKNPNPWSVDRAEEDPKGAMREALKWAGTKGIGIDTPAFSEGYAIFMECMKEAQAAKGEPILPTDTNKEQDEGEC